MKIHKVSPQHKIISEASVKDLHAFHQSGLVWPLEESVLNKRADLEDPGVQGAIKNTMYWIETVLRQEWVPQQSQVEILALHSDASEGDTIRIRYLINNYVLQITSTSSMISIAISPFKEVNENSHIAQAEGKEYISLNLNKFIKDYQKIDKSCKFKLSNTKDGVYANTNNFARVWWEGVVCWTNGETLLVTAPKLYQGSASFPNDDPNWFSNSKRLPMRK